MIQGDLEVKDRIRIDIGHLSVTGKVKAKKIDVYSDLTVGGSCRVDGNLKFGKNHLGGVVEISESATGESLNIGGAVRVGSSLQLSGKWEVCGQVEVGEVLTAREIDVGNNLKAKKVSASKSAKVAGSITTIIGVAAGSLEIGRRSEVKGPIRAKKS